MLNAHPAFTLPDQMAAATGSVFYAPLRVGEKGPGMAPKLYRHVFPYGTFPLDPAVRDQYAHSSLSSIYPLPDLLPLHHPLLQQLEGCYPVVDALPPWWAAFVAQCSSHMQLLLQQVSVREFRAGVIDSLRWRTWVRSLSPSVKEEMRDFGYDQLLHSPSLLPALGEPILYEQYRQWFDERGDKETPEVLDLIISCQPEYMLNISSGDGWTSCLYLHKLEMNEQLPASLYDTGVAVAMLVPHRTTNIWEGADEERKGVVLARTTLRVLFSRTSSQPVIALTRCYHNNPTLASLLFRRCTAFLEHHHLPWVVIRDQMLMRQLRSGLLGIGYQTAQWNMITLHNIPFWIPSSWEVPAVDGAARWQSVPHQHLHLKALAYHLF